MNIVAVSDFHGTLKKIPKYIQASEVDLLIMAGDMEPTYVENMDLASDYFHMGGFRKINAVNEARDQTKWTVNILQPWVKRIAPRHTISVNGNHTFMNSEDVFDLACALNSKTIEVDGIKIGLLAGSMNFSGEWSDEVAEDEMERRILELDPNIEILVSHVPPHGILDKTDGGHRIGCRNLTKAIFGSSFDENGPHFKKLKLHFFGHCHEAHGTEEQEVNGRVIKFHNCSNRIMDVEL